MRLNSTSNRRRVSLHGVLNSEKHDRQREQEERHKLLMEPLSPTTAIRLTTEESATQWCKMLPAAESRRHATVFHLNGLAHTVIELLTLSYCSSQSRRRDARCCIFIAYTALWRDPWCHCYVIVSKFLEHLFYLTLRPTCASSFSHPASASFV